MTARSIATVLLLGIIAGLSVINLALATRDAGAEAPRVEAMTEPVWSAHAGLP